LPAAGEQRLKLSVALIKTVTMVFTAMGLRPAIQILGYVRLDQRLIAVTI
jgi:hypothetical protein